MTGKQLKYLRIKHGLTQSDVAIFLEYENNGKPNCAQISKFEHEIVTINPRIGKLLDFYFRYECI